MTTEPPETPWIPLVEFSAKTGLSLSTLRRYIKANKIAWKLMDGRYLIQANQSLSPKPELFHTQDPQTEKTLETIQLLCERIDHLENELRRTQVDLAELKTLIAFYEEKWPTNA